MLKRDLAGSSPVRGLRVVRADAQTIELRSDLAARVQVTVIAEDLFRLRVTRGRAFSLRPSWAVSKTDWTATPVRISTTAQSVVLKTVAGSLRLGLADGAWELRDAAARVCVSGRSNSIGFRKSEASVSCSLVAGEKIFGLGEMSGPLDKRGLVREFWNIDVLGHAACISPSLRSLYVSIPFGISLRDGRAAGLFWDNPAKQSWDIGQRSANDWRMTAASGEVDLYLFVGPEVSRVVERYSELTGRTPLPPRWALGYHQSRYSYGSRVEVERIAREFRHRKIPCDALYLDIDCMNGYRVFTFGKTFPRAKQLLAKLRGQGFKAVSIVDPGVKRDRRFGTYQRGLALKAFVKAPDGKGNFVGKVWPGQCCLPDFLNARVRKWWGAEQSRLQRQGIAGFWNDMNEPAVFHRPGKTLPLNCPHETDHGPDRHGEVHNVYGMEMARASREAALTCRPEERPFVISRAGYAGIQRYATVWTGDNSSTWEHLAESVPMLLNLSLSGVAFCGADVGGFLDSSNGELLARWTQVAAFTPFFRNHCDKGGVAQEPWAFGPEVEAICKNYIEWRYRLLPYLELLFAEANEHGTPIMRPLFYHYQDDAIAAGIGDQFLLGRDLLVAPVLQQGSVARCVYLPKGEWMNFWNRRERHRGGRHIVVAAPLDTCPIFVRAGVTIPLGPVRQFIA